MTEQQQPALSPADQFRATVSTAVDTLLAQVAPKPAPTPAPGPTPTPPPPAPTPPPAQARFPGDPGKNRAVFGIAPGQDSRANLAATEKAVGLGPLAFRQYHGGSADFAVPNGVLAQQILLDHAAGRVPVISPKPGIEALAAHQHGPELEAFFGWTESLPHYTFVIVHHEAENDWKGDSLAQYVTHAADYRAAQQWVRTCLNKAAKGKPKKTAFLGSLMSWSWGGGAASFGPPDNWNPGRQADGSHVWDVACLDHYLPSYTGTTLETPQWLKAAASIKNWGCLLGITENGVNHGNKNGGAILAAFIKRFIEFYGGAVYLYFSSDAGPGGKPQPNPLDWWILTDANGSLGAFRDGMKAYSKNPNAA